MNATPMQLLDLSTKSVCVRLIYEWADGNYPIVDTWRNEAENILCPDHDWFLWQLYEMPIPRELSIPNPIRCHLEDNIALVLEQVRIWIRYHHVIGFFHDEPSSSLKEYVKSLIWTKDYLVDYTATAKNVVSNPNLNLIEKFRFASMYCLVEDIKNFDVEVVTSMVQNIKFNNAPFMVYWSKYLTNELHTLSPSESEICLKSLCDNNKLPLLRKQELFEDAELDKIKSMMKASIESFLFEVGLTSFELWPPVEYFFSHLDSASRIRRFSSIIERCGKRDRREVLAKLSDAKWNAAGRHSIKELVSAYCDSLEDTRYIWNQFKETMNSKNFCAMIETLVSLSMQNPTNFEIWTPFLIEIWSSARKELKQSAIDANVWRDIGENCIFKMIPGDEKDDFRSRRSIAEPMKFIRLVLKTMNAKNQEEFLRVNFFWLIIWQPFAAVKSLLGEFLVPYARHVMKLKNEIKDSSQIQRSFQILLGFGEFDEFDKLVAFCFSGKNDSSSVSHQTVLHYKWLMMVPQSGMEPLSICLYFTEWRRLYEYVKSVFQNVAIPPDAYIVTLFELGFLPPRVHVEEKISKGEQRDIMECLNAVLSDTDHRLEFLKQKFKNGLYRCLFDIKWLEIMTFKRTDVQDFLLWIYNGDQAAIETNFRQPKLFRKGFLVQLKHCVDRNSFQATESMEEYLTWCFPADVERRRFKRKMINKFRKCEIVKGMLAKRRYRRCMLNWFFDSDSGLIEKFITDRGKVLNVVENSSA